MKKTIFSLLAIILIGIGCNNTGQKSTELEDSASQQSQTSTARDTISKNFKATETFSGNVSGVNVVFEHKNFTQYRLTEGNQVKEGNLNTERGFEQDEDATVFILNFDKPENEQKFFVRLTNGGFVMLDSQRKVVPGVNLEKR